MEGLDVVESLPPSHLTENLGENVRPLGFLIDDDGKPLALVSYTYDVAQPFTFTHQPNPTDVRTTLLAATPLELAIRVGSLWLAGDDPLPISENKVADLLALLCYQQNVEGFAVPPKNGVVEAAG